jgi:N-acetyl-gamma-glutamyl-phosphate reductase
MTETIGLVGARGYVGVELIALIAAHPRFEPAFVSSREWAGQRVADHVPGYHGTLRYVAPDPDTVARSGASAIVLALPNGQSAGYLSSIGTTGDDPVVVDLSADHRFDERWHYGLPELTGNAFNDQRRISNPGCYATAMQLAIAPMRDVIEGPVQCFGVSGYSGAGTRPSDRNDPVKLHDNLMPYSLAGHVHEAEASRQMGCSVEFMPHVGAHFRGLMVTTNLHLSRRMSLEEVLGRYNARYLDEPLVRIVDDAPWVSGIANAHHVEIGGFTLTDDGRRLVVVSVLDNLLKGAATQAIQNLNIAFGFDALAGIPLAAADRGRATGGE